MNIEQIKKDCTFEFEALPEDMSPRGHFASGNDEDDKAMEDQIINEYNSGNPYAWFVAKVTCKLGDFEGVDYLGGCSYKSEADFKNDGYYEDMKEEAFQDLLRKLQHAKNLINKYEINIKTNGDTHVTN